MWDDDVSQCFERNMICHQCFQRKMSCHITHQCVKRKCFSVFFGQICFSYLTSQHYLYLCELVKNYFLWETTCSIWLTDIWYLLKSNLHKINKIFCWVLEYFMVFKPIFMGIIIDMKWLRKKSKRGREKWKKRVIGYWDLLCSF